jgi:hypothetical protein
MTEKPMQAPQRPIATPPDDVLVALYAFVIADAHTFAQDVFAIDGFPFTRIERWPHIDEIVVAIGSPYALRPPSLSVVKSLMELTSVFIRPYSKEPGNPRHLHSQTMSMKELFLSLDFDRTGQLRPDCLYQARVWMVFYQNSGRGHRSTYLTVSAANGPASGGDRRASDTTGKKRYLIRVEPDPEDRRRRRKDSNGRQSGWKNDLAAVVFGGKARFLCDMSMRDTEVIRPERDSIVTIFRKAKDRFYEESLHLGRWDRKSGVFTERLILPAPTGFRTAYFLGTLSLSPSGRYLSWAEPGPRFERGGKPLSPQSDANAPYYYRRILDLTRPVPQSPASSSAPLRIALTRQHGPRPRLVAFWLDDEEWIEVPDRSNYKTNAIKWDFQWQVFSRRTGRMVRTLLRLPIRTRAGEMLNLSLLGYDPSTREIIAYALPVNPPPYDKRSLMRRRLAIVNRDTGAVRLVDVDEAPLWQGKQGEHRVVDARLVRPGGKELLWSSRIGAGDEDFIAVTYWRGSLQKGEKSVVRFKPMVTLLQPSDDIGHEDAAMPAYLDGNGDLLLWYADALWSVEASSHF